MDPDKSICTDQQHLLVVGPIFAVFALWFTLYRVWTCVCVMTCALTNKEYISFEDHHCKMLYYESQQLQSDRKTDNAKKYQLLQTSKNLTRKNGKKKKTNKLRRILFGQAKNIHIFKHTQWWDNCPHQALRLPPPLTSKMLLLPPNAQASAGPFQKNDTTIQQRYQDFLE